MHRNRFKQIDQIKSIDLLPKKQKVENFQE